MKTEKYNWGDIFVFPEDEEAHTDEIRCLDAADIQGHVDDVLKGHRDWVVSKLDFKYDGGELKGHIFFTIPVKAKKLKRYNVSWKEHCVLEATVTAKNKREARRIVEEGGVWPDSKEYLPSTDWEIEEIANKKGR